MVKHLPGVVKKKSPIRIFLHCAYLRRVLSSGALSPPCEALLQAAVPVSWVSFLKRLLPLKAMKTLPGRKEAEGFAALSSRQPAVVQESGGGQQQQDEN